MSRLRKRKVTIVFEAKNVEDPQSILDAVEGAFRASDVNMIVRDGQMEEQSPRTERPFHNEQLENSAKDAAAERIESKPPKATRRAQTQKSAPDSRSDALKEAEEVVRVRANLWQRIAGGMKRGYEVTLYQVVKAAMDSLRQA